MKLDPIKPINAMVKAFPEQKAFKFISNKINVEDFKLGGDNPHDGKLYYIA